MNASPPLLELVQVSKRFEEIEAADAFPVLDGIDLRVEAGESLSIVGPSGSGKSTLLNLIGGLDFPTTGQVLLEGKDLSRLSESELAHVRNRRVGFVFQAHHLLPQCTVLENVLVPTLVNADPSGGDQDATGRARRLLERVGLGHRLDRRPGQLSGGEKQRAAVVRALINRPGLLLADEPTGSLDRANSENLGRILADLNREEGVTLIVVTHSQGLASLMRRRFELNNGKLIPMGSGK